MKISQPIAIRGIRKTYGQVVALDDVGLDVAPGEFLTLLGPSGSGKSTLLMIIAGFIRPDAGSVRVEGRELVLMPPHRRDIGLVFQNYALFPHMSVAQNIAFPLRYKNCTKAEIAARVERVLGLVKLRGYGDRRIDALSGGQRQRVALARAIVFNPMILLMDEPLSALDKKLREQMQVEIKHLHKEIGTTTIYVTHDQREALTMSDRIAVMNQGSIAQIGPPTEVYERPENHFVAGFVGDSQFVEIDLASATSGRVGASTFTIAHAPPQGVGRTFLVLRPEKVELAKPGAERHGFNTLECRVGDVLYQGEQVLISVVLDTGETVMVRRGTGEETMRTLPRTGERMVLCIHVNDTVVVAE
jgi:putative spermidine/putrescine transport system ATP-binding protein